MRNNQRYVSIHFLSFKDEISSYNSAHFDASRAMRRMRYVFLNIVEVDNENLLTEKLYPDYLKVVYLRVPPVIMKVSCCCLLRL
jgi:hypothetical protein